MRIGDTHERLIDLLYPGDRTYEHEIHFRSFTDSWEAGPTGGTKGSHWDSNFPRPYLDTSFEDTYPNRAWGVSDGGGLRWGHVYQNWMRVLDGPKDLASVRMNGDRGFRLFEDCYETPWCIFSSQQRNLVPYGAAWFAPTTRGWFSTNRLRNPSFEDCTQEWSLYSPVSASGASMTCYSDSANPALEGSRFLQFHAGTGSYASIYQDWSDILIYGREGGHQFFDTFSGEVGLRCKHTNAGSCSVTLVVWGRGRNPSEKIERLVSVPNDNKWIRVGTDRSGFSQDHDFVRFEVYVGPNRHLDVDFTTLHWTDSQ